MRILSLFFALAVATCHAQTPQPLEVTPATTPVASQGPVILPPVDTSLGFLPGGSPRPADAGPISPGSVAPGPVGPGSIPAADTVRISGSFLPARSTTTTVVLPPVGTTLSRLPPAARGGNPRPRGASPVTPGTRRDIRPLQAPPAAPTGATTATRRTAPASPAPNLPPPPARAVPLEVQVPDGASLEEGFDTLILTVPPPAPVERIPDN